MIFGSAVPTTVWSSAARNTPTMTAYRTRMRTGWGSSMGGLSTAGDLGAALGPLVGYALLETSGLRSAYALCAALTVSALLVLALVRGARPAAQRA